MSNVSIKLLREGAKLPTRGSAFAAGYDLYACLDGDKELIIPPHATAMLPTGLSFALPEGTFGAVVARSGLASKQGLRPANCLGVIETDMVKVLGEETLKDLAEQTPLGRLGKPEDIAAAVAYLASDKASFVTGQVLAVDGAFVL